jgi:hypothetical protein
MPPWMNSLATVGFGMELLYSFVIIVCSLIIYFGTRELYKLSSHKGIKYFRQAFLFFALAYFFRSFIKFILIVLEVNLRNFRTLGIWVLGLFMYASTIAILYLLYSIKWKPWEKHKSVIYLFHILALIVSLVSIFAGAVGILLTVQVVLFIFVALASYPIHKKSKKKHSMYAIYLLLFGFWILNVIDIVIPNFLQTFQIFIYLASIGVFLLILYKVVKKVGSN